MGWFEGEVKYAHVLGPNGLVLFRVVYTDGDCEDLELCVVKKCLLPVENVCKPKARRGRREKQEIAHNDGNENEQAQNDSQRPKPCASPVTPSISCDIKGNGACGDLDAGAKGADCESTTAKATVGETGGGNIICPINSDPVEMLNITAQSVIEGFECAQHAEEDSSVVVDAALLARLHSAVIAVTQVGGGQICAIESNTLKLVLQVLENHICYVSELPTLSRAFMQDDDALDIAGTVYTGLEASAIALYIITARNITSRLIGDEMIDGCLLLLRNYTSSLRACFDPARAETPDVRAVSEDSKVGIDSGSNNNSDSGRKRARRKQQHAPKEEEKAVGGCTNMPAVHKLVLEGSGRVCEVLGLWERLVRSVALQHKVIMPLCSLCTDILAFDPCSCHSQDAARLPALQNAAIGVLVAVFATHVEYRSPLIDDCVGLLPGLPTSKKYLRLLPCQWPHEGSFIQMVSSLVMRFIQALCSENEVSAARTSCSQLVRRLLARCAIRVTHKDSGTPALSIVGAEEAAWGAEMCNSFRNLVGFMVDDWIAVLPAPEWPASEILLGALSADLVEILRDYSTHSVLSTQFSLDTLGRIAARVTGLMRNERLDPVPLVFYDRKVHICGEGGDERKNSLALNSSPSDGDGCMLMDDKEAAECGVVCVNCNHVFHQNCTAPLSRGGGEDMQDETSPFALRRKGWTCRTCTLSQQVLKHRSKLAQRYESTRKCDDGNLERLKEIGMYLENGGNEEMDVKGTDAIDEKEVQTIEEKDVLRQLILNAVSFSALSNSWFAEARLALVYLWADKEDSVERSAHWKHQKVCEKASAWRSSWNNEPVLTHSELVKASRKLLLSVTGNGEGLSSGLDALLSHFLLLLGANTVVLRSRAVKALGGVIAADPDIMLKDNIHKALRLRFYDEAISVREAVVNLVGTYLLQDRDKEENTKNERRTLLTKYLEPLMERLLDKGVSVRKSVVKILRGALLADPTHPSRSFVCHSLVERASILKEEESIRNLIHGTFTELWFVKGYTSQDVAQATAIHMMEVVVSMGSTTEWFVNLLKGILAEDTNHQSEDRLKCGSSIKKNSINSGGGLDSGEILSCQTVVKCVMGFLLLLDEGKFAAVHGGKFSLDSSLNDPEIAYLASIMLLSAFCECRPLLLVDHIDGLYPYLRGKIGFSRSLEGQISFLIAGMIKTILPFLRQPDPSVMKVVSDNLVSVAHRCGSQAVDASIDCLVKLSVQVTKDYGSLDTLLTKCFRNLLQYLRSNNKERYSNSSAIAHVQRSLVIVGSICRYRPLSGSVDDVVNLTASSPTHLKQLYEALRLHAFPPPEESHANGKLNNNSSKLAAQVQAKGLAGLISLLIGSPRYMLLAEKEGVIKRALTSKSARVLEEALMGLSEVLKVGEERVESGEAREAMANAGVSTAERVQGDQDAEASVASGVIQMHADDILRNVLHEQPSVRTAAVMLLAVILNQGLMNPQDVMASLLALQGDVENPIAQQVALKEVLLRDDRNPNFLRSKLADGVALAFDFQYRTLGPTKALGVLPSDSAQTIERGAASIFAPIYTTCLRPTRRARQYALQTLVALFGRGSGTTPPDNVENNIEMNVEMDDGGALGIDDEKYETSMRAGMISFLGRTLALLP